MKRRRRIRCARLLEVVLEYSADSFHRPQYRCVEMIPYDMGDGSNEKCRTKISFARRFVMMRAIARASPSQSPYFDYVDAPIANFAPFRRVVMRASWLTRQIMLFGAVLLKPFPRPIGCWTRLFTCVDEQQL